MPAVAAETPLETVFDTTTAGLRELNERVIAEAKKAGSVTVDVFESTFRTLADFTENVGASSPVELVSTVTAAQAKATRDLTGAYAKAARALLN
jgi:hypothetical protein